MSVNLGTASTVQTVQIFKDVNLTKAVAGLTFSTAACGIVAAEMALQALENLANPREPNAGYNLSANLGGAIFYGLCASNTIAGTSVVGAAIFGIYAVGKRIFGSRNDREYFTAKIIGECFERVGRVALEIGRIIFKIFEPLFELLSHIPIPKHPIWVGVFVLTGAIVLHQTALPVFFLRPA